VQRGQVLYPVRTSQHGTWTWMCRRSGLTSLPAGHRRWQMITLGASCSGYREAGVEILPSQGKDSLCVQLTPIPFPGHDSLWETPAWRLRSEQRVCKDGPRRERRRESWILPFGSSASGAIHVTSFCIVVCLVRNSRAAPPLADSNPRRSPTDLSPQGTPPPPPQSLADLASACALQGPRRRLLPNPRCTRLIPSERFAFLQKGQSSYYDRTHLLPPTPSDPQHRDTSCHAPSGPIHLCNDPPARHPSPHCPAPASSFQSPSSISEGTRLVAPLVSPPPARVCVHTGV
jgi:hypothetical protein